MSTHRWFSDFEGGRGLAGSSIGDWVSRLDVVSLLLGGSIGAFLGTWLNHYVARPKLKLVGHSSGLMLGARITNIPSNLGLKLGPTVIFGRRVHQDFLLGLPIDRTPAQSCHAWLIDKESNRAITSLFWRIDGVYRREVDIPCGEAAEVMLFTQRGAAKGKYYPWHPGQDGEEHPKGPNPNDPQFEGSRKFIVEITFSHGRRKMRFPIDISEDFTGRYLYRSPTGGGGLG